MTGNELRKMRKAAGMTYRDVARALGWKAESATAIPRWEKGEVKITDPSAVKLRAVFNGKTKAAPAPAVSLSPPSTTNQAVDIVIRHLETKRDQLSQMIQGLKNAGL